MNGGDMLHAYDVYYKDYTYKHKLIKGEIIEKDGIFYVSGKPDPNISHIKRLECCDRPYRKPISKATREKIYKMFDGRCAYCGKHITIKQLRVDHVVAFSEGGEDSIKNYMPSCIDCNTIKGSSNIDNLRKTVANFILTIKKDVRYRMLLAYGLISENPHDILFLYETEGKQ